MSDDEAESVAKALYNLEPKARGWAREPERLKAAFRQEAQTTLAALHEARTRSAPSMEPTGLHAESVGVSIRDIVFRSILIGPKHTYTRTNAARRQILPSRPLLGLPMREAFPELEGQGYFEILDWVYKTQHSYLGQAQHVLIDGGPDTGLSERFLNFSYRPIIRRSTKERGVLVETRDVTHRVKAMVQCTQWWVK